MDGRGRWIDNMFVEHSWRTLKVRVTVPAPYAMPQALSGGMAETFRAYKEERVHAALDYRTPCALYREAA